MNSERLELINAVLTLSIGEIHHIREDHLTLGTMCRYRHGWDFFIDHAIDTVGIPRALLGWTFRDEQDVADFLTGDLGQRLGNFAMIGERIE